MLIFEGTFGRIVGGKGRLRRRNVTEKVFPGAVVVPWGREKREYWMFTGRSVTSWRRLLL
jgi:hypothetical protein